MNNQTLAEADVTFGDWLRRQRKILGWSQRVLAQRVGCTAATIRKIEAAERKPSWQLAGLIATVLGVPDDARVAFLQAARQGQSIMPLWPASRASVAPSSHGSSHKPSHNLPVPLTSFVNRLCDSANLAALLLDTDVRLLTLLGPPGIGKTRLGIHTAETVAEHFRDGVWFVDLAPITDASLVLQAIAYVLGVMEVGVTPLLERLRAALADKELLLVLDNFEQVNEAATEVVALLHGSRGLKFLVTSRVPLQLAGEHEYTVPPLSLPTFSLPTLFGPASDRGPDYVPDELLACEAMQLFVARARQHQYTFALTLTNASQISAICLRLEGIPLALELAAAALRRMTLSQLAGLLQEEATWLHALHSPARDLPPRHRTLYSAIAWSYTLLEADAQLCFRQLGCFVGGFTAAAAQAVCSADEATLALLSDHSLLVHSAERWQMLEMIREYALAQMSSEERTLSQERHSAYYVAHANLKPDAIAHDYANFRAVLQWTIAKNDSQAALTLSIELFDFWHRHGYSQEGLHLTRAALAIPVLAIPGAVASRLRIDALENISTLAWMGHQHDTALEFAEQALALAHSNDQPEELALALNLLGRIFIEQGDYDRAEAVLEQCLHSALQVPHLYNPGCPLAQLGEVELGRRDWEAAQRHLTQALTYLASKQGLFNRAHTAIAHTCLAEIALVHNDYAQARDELRQALPHARLSILRLRCLLVTLAGLLLTTLHTTLHTTPEENAGAAAAFLGAEAVWGEYTDSPSLLLFQSLIVQRSTSAQRTLTPREWQAKWQIGQSWTLAEVGAEAEKWLAMDLKE